MARSRTLLPMCCRKYTPEPSEGGYSEAVRQEALKLSVDGMHFRRIARGLPVARQSVANWVKAYADQLPNSPRLPPSNLEVNELDALFTCMASKKTKSISSPT
jgi:transposase-like protein